jgi:hypothetical protein
MFLSLILCGNTLCGPGGELPPAPGAAHPAVHAVAFVNDPLSHGMVGDGLLSFNEAIRLHNGTLTPAQLSPAETAQVQLIPGTGTQTFLAWANFDGSSTPIVTVQQDLDPIVDTPFGFYVNSVNEPTVLDFSTSTGTHGLRVPANSFEMKDIVLSGGQYGIDVTQTDVSGQAGLILNHVGFENQVQFGVRVTTTTPNAIGRAYLDGCTFVNAATAVVFDENVAGRTTIFELHDCRIGGAQAGVDVVLGSGGTGRYTFDRVVIDAANTGLRLLRPGGGNRTALLESQHVDVRAGSVGVSIACAPTGVTWATMRMWNVRSTNNATALVLGNLGDSVYGDLEELTLDGAVSVLCGAGQLPLAITNVRCKNGPVALGTLPAQALTVTASRFDACTIHTQGSAPIPFAGCCFVGGTLAGTATAPAQCTNGFVQGAGSYVTQSGSLPAPQLGSMKLLPDTITIGSTATFQADLPNGLFGVFVLGFTDLAPALQPQPLHLYTVPAYTFTLPGIYRFQQSYSWPIPNVQLYLGMNLTVQMVALPDPGVAAPPYQLPPGRHFSLQ